MSFRVPESFQTSCIFPLQYVLASHILYIHSANAIQIYSSCHRCLTTRTMQPTQMLIPVVQHVFLAKFLKKGICISAGDTLMSVFKR